MSSGKRWKELAELIFAGVAALASVYNAIIDDQSMQDNRKHSEWELHQEEDNHKPNFQMEKEGEIPLGTERYVQYILYNMGEVLSSGEMQLEAEFVISYQGVILKNIVFDNCFYNNTISYEVKSREVCMLLWMPDKLRYIEQVIRESIERRLGDSIGVEKIEVELCAVASFDYITQQNRTENEFLIMKFGDHPSCERYVDGEYMSHDKYHLTKDVILSLEQEEEFQEIIAEIIERYKYLKGE